MAWENLKQALLEDASAIVENRAASQHREHLQRLSEIFFSRFSAEDMRDRPAENLYGMLYGLLRFIDSWPGDKAKVRLLNPQISSHGWESASTVLVILCRDLPFCTASVRGELNQLGLGI